MKHTIPLAVVRLQSVRLAVVRLLSLAFCASPFASPAAHVYPTNPAPASAAYFGQLTRDTLVVTNPVTSSGIDTNAVRDIAASATVTNAGAVTESKSYTDTCCSTLAVASTNVAYKAITNAVTSGYICTVEAAASMTNAVTQYSDGKFFKKAGTLGASLYWDEFDNLTFDGDNGGGVFTAPYCCALFAFNVGSTWIGDGTLNNITLPTEEMAVPGDRFALLSDIPDAYTKTEIEGNTVTNGGAKAYTDAQFTTNNTALVSVVTNIAPSKAKGISLADPVRHCNWYQCVTNGVFYWLVEE